MSAVYSYIVHKNKGHKGDSPVFQLLSNFVSFYGKPLFMVSLPGYLSIQIKDLDDFSNRLKSILPYAYFTVGMNGEGKLPSGIKRIDYINKKFKNGCASISSKKDHSKMMFLFELDDNHKIGDVFEVDYSRCIAVLIGSSNQNLTTYFNRANYGECDVLLVDLNFVCRAKGNLVPEDNFDEYAISLTNNIVEKSLISVSKEIQNNNFIKKLAEEVL